MSGSGFKVPFKVTTHDDVCSVAFNRGPCARRVITDMGNSLFGVMLIRACVVPAIALVRGSLSSARKAKPNVRCSNAGHEEGSNEENTEEEITATLNLDVVEGKIVE